VDNNEPEGIPRGPRGPKDYLDLAKSPTATAQQLRWLAGSPYSFVLDAVAQHPATPVDVLERLVPSDGTTWIDQSLLLALAEHPASSLAVLTSIAQQVPRLLHERDAQPGFAAGIALSVDPIPRRRSCSSSSMILTLRRSSARSPPEKQNMSAS
jgi:hypothetical protein